MSHLPQKPKILAKSGAIPVLALIVAIPFILIVLGLVLFGVLLLGNRGDANQFGAGGLCGAAYNCRGGLKSGVRVAGYVMSNALWQIFVKAGEATGVPPAYLAAQMSVEAPGYLNGKVWTDDVVSRHSFFGGKQLMTDKRDDSAASVKPPDCAYNYITASGPMQLDRYYPAGGQAGANSPGGNYDPTRIKMFEQSFSFKLPPRGDCYLDTSVFYAAIIAKYQQERMGMDLTTSSGRQRAWKNYGTTVGNSFGGTLEKRYQALQDPSTPDCQQATQVACAAPGGFVSGNVAQTAASLPRDSAGKATLPPNPKLYTIANSACARGSPETIAAIIVAAQQWTAAGHAPFRVSDIDAYRYKHGDHISGCGGHKSHDEGYDVDITAGGATSGNFQLSVDLASAFIATGQTQCIGYDYRNVQSAITSKYGNSRSPKWPGPYIVIWGGHGTHFHVRFIGSSRGC